MIITSKDVTHLGVGIDYAFRHITDQVPSMAMLEVISPALRLFDIQTVYSFTQSMHAKLAKQDFTSFILMERDAHDAQINSSLEEIFDGIIDIRNVGNSLEIGIISIRGSHFQPEYRSLNKMRDKLTVDVSRNISETEIVDTMKNHGMVSQLEELQTELSETQTEKQKIETRMEELMEREVEFDKRHKEMKATIANLESEVKQQLSQMPKYEGHDPKHKEELARILAVMDNLLEKLPEETIDKFAKSGDFKLYEKIMDLYLEEDEE